MGKYLDKIRQHERTHPVVMEEALTQQKALDQSPTVHPGDRITWTRGDLTVQHGTVDVVHLDTDGQAWAFCTVPGGSWATVNTKYVTKTEGGPTP
jgi:hypothetical protein